ncbi:MAG TPA: class I SAM-dependent methyltransferase [Gammaproteobacteria bacterium]|jgi:SAM-dependent methyltransferase|nr:class I SAM-dependent methyltransferase [Gammaproteobacteria bacterium]
MNNYTHRDDCRLCGSEELDLVLPILPSAIGDAFVTKDQLNQAQDLFPLDTYLCLGCGHLQNLDIVNPEILFRNYTYRTSISLGLVDHFKEYANEVVLNLGLLPNSLIVEIGSNDGSLLKAFKNLGMRVKGVDPARDIVKLAINEGIPTLSEFFTWDISQQICQEDGKATLICANNVFAHIDNMTDLMKGIRNLLTDDGVFVFEVSYVPDILENFVFDTIYHEHVSHHALIPLERFFNQLDMTLFDIKKVRSKGGSIRGFAQPLSTGKRLPSAQLKQMLVDEQKIGIISPKIYRDFYTAINERKSLTLNYIDKLLSENKTVAAYGASTTTTTLIYHFELDRKIDFIVDDNSLKHGLFSPGAHIPVISSEELCAKNPDVVIILAWIYSENIINKNHQYLKQGGEFLIPLPEFKIVRSDFLNN